jgi:hypothetical protein
MSAATPPDDTGDDGKLLEALDAGDPARTPEEEAARRPYQRLIERIQDLDEIAPPPGWEARAEQRWHAQRATARKRRLRPAAIALSLGLGGAAIAAVLLMRPCASTPEAPAEQVALTAIPSGTRRAGEPTVNDQLRAQARIEGAFVELRIYRDTTLFARCPGDARCQIHVPNLEITLKITREGTYQAVAFSSHAPIPAPTPDGLDSDLAGARDANVKILVSNSQTFSP